MPIYEYQCQKCQAHLEVMQKLSDKPLKKCAACGGKLEKQWSNTSFQLKGAGWYVTDYAKSGEKAKAEKEAAPAKDGGSSSSDTASETPAAATAASDGKADEKKTVKASADEKSPSKPAAKPKK